ncbi:MAG: type II secretion system protein GspH [Rhodospirillales bacterium]|nr:type II secretion system protein GspH [Rhodospirillales bacterium]
MPTLPPNDSATIRRPRRGDTGFTLVELVVVLAVLALVYVVAVPPMLSQLEGARLNAAVRALTGALKEARGQAIATARDVRFTIADGAGEWRFGERRGNAGRGVMLRVDVPPVGEGENRIHAIRFFPDGASTGGRIWATAGQDRWRIDVDWLTGRVSWRPE